MKKLALFLAFPAAAFATDYTRCPKPFEVNIDADGKVKAADFYETKSVKTEGNITTLVIKPKSNTRFGFYGGMESKVTVERDEQGRVVAVTTGGDKPSKEMIEQFRRLSQGVYPGGMVGGFGGGSSSGSINIWENGKARQVDLSNITDQDLQTIGAKNVKAADVRASASEWSRSSKSQGQLQQVYQAYANYMPVNIPVGNRYEYNIVNGACVPEKISSLNYSSQSDKVEPHSFYDREACDKVIAAWNKHKAKIQECQAYDYQEVGKEQVRLLEEKVLQQLTPNYYGFGMGSYGGGYVGGGMGGGGYFGSPAQNLSGYSGMCEMYQNWHAMGENSLQGGGAVGGSTAGSSNQ